MVIIGILQKATDAKNNTERASVVEQARTDVLGYQAENKGTDLKKSQLQSVLVKYFKNVPDLTDMKDSEILKTKLDTLEEYGNHNIEVREIFYGNFLVDNPTVTATADEINTKIGTVVNGYSAKDLEWQVFYADDSETFLISKTLAKTGWSIPIKGNNKDTEYKGSEDVMNSSYGLKWNSKWLELVSNRAEDSNAKATAYLCDKDNWEEFKIGSATYAVGGPTIELLIASWNKIQGTNIEISNDDVRGYGYKLESLNGYSGLTPLESSTRNGIYNPDNNWYFASPCDPNTGSGDDVKTYELVTEWTNGNFR